MKKATAPEKDSANQMIEELKKKLAKKINSEVKFLTVF